jgi:hypothetical protein
MKKTKKIHIDFKLPKEVLEHLKALRDWEKRSKRLNGPLSGPIKKDK